MSAFVLPMAAHTWLEEVKEAFHEVAHVEIEKSRTIYFALENANH